jgi:hypothetical protein
MFSFEDIKAATFVDINTSTQVKLGDINAGTHGYIGDIKAVKHTRIWRYQG